MSGKVTRGNILKALEEQHAGQILAGGNTDAADKLLRSLQLRVGMRSRLCTLLCKMADDHDVIIEANGVRFTMIQLPNAVSPTEDGGQEDMATPRTLRMTTYPRTGDGKDIPATLPDNMVGPVTTRYLSPKAEEDIVSMAEFAIDKFCELRKERMAHHEALAIVQSVVIDWYGSITHAPAIVEATAKEVFNYLTDHRKLCRDGGQGNRIVYLFRLPAAQASSEASEPTTQVNGAMAAQLVKTNHELEAKVAGLTRELEEARATHVTREDLERMIAKLEEAGEENEGLRRKLDEGVQALQRIQRAHVEELTQQRTQHEAALRGVQDELEISRTNCRRLEAELAKQQSSEIPPDLRARMDKVLSK